MGLMAGLALRARQAAGRLPVARVRALLQRRDVRLALRAAAVLVVLLFLAYAVYKNWDELSQYEWSADWRYLVLASLWYGLCFTAVMLAWHRVMAAVGGVTGAWVNARIYCYSSLPKRVPGVVWYIASRAAMYQAEGVAGSMAVLATLLETVLLVVSALLTYLGSLAFRAQAGLARDLPPGTALLLLAPLLVVLYPPILNRIIGWLQRRVKAEGELVLGYRTVLGLVLMYVPAWVLGGIDLYLLANAVYPVPPSLLPAIIGAWAAASAVSFLASYLIQGLGVAEVTLGVLLSRFLPPPVAILIVILFRLLLTVGEVAWALLFAWLIGRVKK
jgi:hypothetical protein